MSSSSSSDSDADDVLLKSTIYTIDLKNWEYSGHFLDTHYPFFLTTRKSFQEWRSFIPIEFAKLLCSKPMCSWRNYASKDVDFDSPSKNLFIQPNVMQPSVQLALENCKHIIVYISNISKNTRSDKYDQWSINVQKFLSTKQYDKIFIYKCITIALYYFMYFFKSNVENISVYVKIEDYDFKCFWNALVSRLKTNIIEFGAVIE